MAGVAVALAEGGSQAGQGAVTPSADGLPRHIMDPTFRSSFCLDEYCTSGSYWQVSSAFISNPPTNTSCNSDTDCNSGYFCYGQTTSKHCIKKCTSNSDCTSDYKYCSSLTKSSKTCFKCPVCEDSVVNCNYLKNPLCAGAISYRFTSQPDQSCGDITNQCSATQMRNGIDPKCNFGVFPLYSCGWNSPPCSHMYRQSFPKEGLPFCRLAIESCELAQKELLKYGWDKKCDVTSSNISKVVQNACKGYIYPGNWAIPTNNSDGTKQCTCGSKLCGS